ncbi:MAG: response regulator [Methanomicrobiaceae archaeon]|nr:response regulator [Methanomicrobiaceae archaeon]
MFMKTFLLIDSDPAALNTMLGALEEEGVSIATARSAEEGYSMIAAGAFDLVIAARALPGISGVDLLEALRSSGNEVPFILLFGEGEEHAAGEALRCGADGAVRKDATAERVTATLFGVGRMPEERSRMGRELEECRERVRLLSEHATDMIFRYDFSPCRGFASISPSAAAITGYAPGELYADPDLFFTITEPGDRELFARTWRGEDGVEEPYSILLARKDGRRVWVEVQCTPLRDDAGAVVGVEGVVRDVTLRTEIERDLRAQSRRLRERMKELNCLIGISEAIETEPSITALCQTIVDLIPTAYRFPEIACARLTIDGGEFRTANFGESPLVQICPVSVYGEVAGTVEVRYLSEHEEMDEGTFLAEKEVLLDAIAARIGKIFERYRTEEALHEVISKLNLLNSITRHDILNQIAVLRAYQELCREKISDPVMQEYLQCQEMVTVTIQRLINFTRDYQDIGVLSPGWQPVYETIGHALHTTSPPLFGVDIDVEAYEVYADPLLEKVFFNLIENARSHGGGGVTRVLFSCEETDEGLILVCEDDGEGIPGVEKELIFEQGFGKKTGYGMFLAREILSITGLSIRECGVPGAGARFEIIAPPGTFRQRAGRTKVPQSGKIT